VTAGPAGDEDAVRRSTERAEDATVIASRSHPNRGRNTARAVGRRLAHIVPVLLIVSLATLLLSEFVPGDPAVTMLGEGATPDQIVAAHHALGLDEPLPRRYVDWLGDVAHGDLGTSVRTGVPVMQSIKDRVPVSLELAVLGLAIALATSVPAAIYAAYRQNKAFDRIATASSSALISSPAFLTGLLLLYLFSVNRGWFPVTGWIPIRDGLKDNLRHAFLPAVTLALVEIPTFFRLLRSDMIANLQEDFILAAAGKGMSNRYVLVRHALRPSCFSLLTVVGLSLGRLIGGTIVVESLFVLPGLGRLAIDAALNQDLVVVQGVVMFVAVTYVLVNTIVDLFYVTLDPRVRATSE